MGVSSMKKFLNEGDALKQELADLDRQVADRGRRGRCHSGDLEADVHRAQDDVHAAWCRAVRTSLVQVKTEYESAPAL